MRGRVIRLTLVAASLAVAAATVGQSYAAVPKLRGTVGPGFTIKLKQGATR